jgi:hypothetical protein
MEFISHGAGFNTLSCQRGSFLMNDLYKNQVVMYGNESFLESTPMRLIARCMLQLIMFIVIVGKYRWR